jgi:hypothetical protein
MIRLLRPGFHSGTLPKAFAAMRRESRHSQSMDGKRIRRRRAAIRRVEVDVRRFVERELISLLSEVGFLPGIAITVNSLHVSTNRIEVELVRADQRQCPAVLRWTYLSGKLTGTVEPMGWIGELDEGDYNTVKNAMLAIFQRSGVEEVRGPLSVAAVPNFAWEDWLDRCKPAKNPGKMPTLAEMAS